MTEQPTTAAGRALLTDRLTGFDDDAANHALPSRGTAHDVNRAMLEGDWLERILAIEAEARQQDGAALRLLRRLVAVVDAAGMLWSDPVPADSIAAIHDAKEYLAALARLREPAA